MPTNLENPAIGITPQHLPQLNEALAKIDNGLKAVELAKRAGIDVTVQEAALRDAQGKILQIKQTYFPGQ